MIGQGEDMCPDPIRRKGRKTLAKVYDSLSGWKGPGQVAHHRAAHQEGGARHSERIDGGGVVGGRSVSRIRTAKEYISVVESFFRKLRVSKTRSREPRRRVFRPCGSC